MMQLHRAGLWVIAASVAFAGAVAGAQTLGAMPVSGDPWSGSYDLRWAAGTPAAAAGGSARAILRRAVDADPGGVTPEEGADLARWSLSTGEDREDQPLLRRFTSREYRELDWTALHAAGAIECLEGARMFICRTTPDARIMVGEGEGGRRETLPTRTGMFGVALHAGTFELEATAAAAEPRSPRDPLAIPIEEIEGERAPEVSECLDAAVSSNAMGACVNLELRAQDTRLNDVYRALMRQFDDAGKARLRADERAWIQARDAGCEEDLMGGTGDLYDRPNCLLNETVRRRLVLESMLDTREGP
ncbi:lysozyme inhibitor LprI family protein [Croceibacterium mercuriale]|uniref:lysozyme inhibitor LprI family protein n=1 Tax=Croceibacterium mercuriale TaxID=1572751 RepID=UPI00068CC34C|nr:lysozyme inhibitor LprI family protein [Croceibacterium mercuriale]